MSSRFLLCAAMVMSAVGALVAGDDPRAVWTACMQGIDTPEKLEAVRLAVASNRPVRIAFANSSTSRAHGTPHDDFEQREMYVQAKYFGLPIEIIRIQPVDVETTNRTLEVVYREAIERGDIVCDYRSYWDDVGPDYHGAAKLIAAHPEKLFILPYGEIRGAKCPPTGCSLQGMALHGDGTGLKNVVLTTPLSPKTAGKILRPSRRTPDDLATVTFVTPSGWAGGAGDTCRAASMATVLAAWIWSVRGDRPSAAEIVRIMAEGRALPAVSEKMNFTDEHLKTLKEQLSEAIQPDALGRKNLIYDAPLSFAGVLSRVKASSPR